MNEMTKREEIVETLAVALAYHVDGKEPDDWYEDFNRSASADVVHLGEYEGWEEDVFPRIYYSEDWAVVAEKILADLMLHVPEVFRNEDIV